MPIKFYVQELNCLFIGFPKAGHTMLYNIIIEILIKYCNYDINFKKVDKLPFFSLDHKGLEFIKESNLSIKEALERKAKVIVLVRNPYDRLFSGLCDKHIRILNNKNFDEIIQTGHMNSIYKYLNKDCTNINMKDMIDFYCKINPSYKIDNHFLPISDIIKNLNMDQILLYDKTHFVKIENNFINQINLLLNINLNEEIFNKKLKHYNEYLDKEYDDNLLLELKPYKCIKECEYYKKKVKEKFIDDFITFKYDF